MPRRLAAAVLTLSLQASAEPVRTLDLTQDFGASPSSVSERQAVYDELTVAGMLRELLDKSIACDNIVVEVVSGPNTLEDYDAIAE